MTTSLDTHVKGPLKASLGIEVSEDEPASSLLNRIWAEPSMDVHGVAGQRFRSPKRHQYDKSLLAEFLEENLLQVDNTRDQSGLVWVAARAL